MRKSSILGVCLLGVAMWAMPPTPAAAQLGPIQCCAAINLPMPFAAHGYVGRVNLNPDGPVQLRVLIPTVQGVTCNRDYPIPLLATDIASFTAELANHEALVINANFFEWSGNPHSTRCGRSIGLARSDGTNFSVPGRQVHNLYPDALLFLGAQGGRFVPQPRTLSDLPVAMDAIVAAVSGIMIVQNSVRVCGLTQACPRWEAFSRWDRIPRTAIGLTANRQRLVVVVFEDDYPRNGQPGTSPGVSIDVLADYFLTYHQDVTDAIMLDGSGSSALVYHPPGALGVPALETTPHDIDPGSGTRQHRPVPINLAFVAGQERRIRIQTTVYGSAVPSGAEIIVPDGVEDLEGEFVLQSNSRLSFGVARSVWGSKARIAPNTAIVVEPGARFSIGSGISTQSENRDGGHQ